MGRRKNGFEDSSAISNNISTISQQVSALSNRISVSPANAVSLGKPGDLGKPGRIQIQVTEILTRQNQESYPTITATFQGDLQSILDLQRELSKCNGILTHIGHSEILVCPACTMDKMGNQEGNEC
jgi:hypothetical protein